MTSSGIKQFVIIAAERTGSNLLCGMLESHPEVVMGGELFNPRSIEDRQLSWPLAHELALPGLMALREEDPAAFLATVQAQAAEQGALATGFKLLYFHGESCPAAVKWLLGDTDVHVIHLRRDNLMARYVSHMQARASGTWAQERNAKSAGQPAVRIDFDRMVEDILHVELLGRETDKLFADHPRLDLTYEDLAADPLAVGRNVAEFLGVSRHAEMEIKYRKTGAMCIADAVENYPEIVGRMQRWMDFLDR